MTEPLRIGVVGLGTVGIGTIEKITKYNEEAEKYGLRPIEIVCVSARDQEKDRGIDLSAYDWEGDPVELAKRPDIDVVVEVIGNGGPTAKNVIQTAFEHGKHVVTANKDLMASPDGLELAKIADDKKLSLKIEAAVLGGNQIVSSTMRGHIANEFVRVSGIANGTTNYMLTLMSDKGYSYEEALADAQAKGYAEADPTADVSGLDAFSKLKILDTIIHRVRPSTGTPDMIGITDITPNDIKYAQNHNLTIKHLVTSQMVEGKIVQTVSPWLLRASNRLVAVGDATNAITLYDANGKEAYTSIGPGAGQEATATSVLADLSSIAYGEHRPTFGVHVDKLQDAEYDDVGTISGEFYIRVNLVDEPGSADQAATVIATNGLNIRTAIQEPEDYPPAEDGSVPYIVTVNEAKYKNVRAAGKQLEAAPVTRGTPCIMRLEPKPV